MKPWVTHAHALARPTAGVVPRSASIVFAALAAAAIPIMAKAAAATVVVGFLVVNWPILLAVGSFALAAGLIYLARQRFF